MNTLYLDPGYTRTGWAVFTDPDNLTACGLIETVKGNTARKSDDACNRCAAIAQEIALLALSFDIDRLGWEVPPGGAQCAAALRALSWVTGVVAATAALIGLPDTRFTPRDVKFAATGDPNGTKEMIESAVLKLWPSAAAQMPRAKGRREHVCDALACRCADMKGVLV